MFAFIVITMTFIVFACAMAWLASEALRNWAEVPKYWMLEREQNYERSQRAQRRNAALIDDEESAAKDETF
ncbi:hypothetical protein HU727_004005 [Pseudomonas sp. SWRI153]|uniref:Uncharacterized protein n=1 Tax=Pseudomonas khorasanensis TaxID=2745508 RepID=A0A923EZA6_9PSED|nr:hypothetical protein [Pseudomonas khorasanensis]MBV4484746.1 hypothetical protein [Pseudomonas khorasanensis]